MTYVQKVFRINSLWATCNSTIVFVTYWKFIIASIKNATIVFFANPQSLLPINIVSLPLFWHKFTRGLQVSLLCLLMLYFVHEKSLCGSIALFLGKARSFQLNKSQTMRLKPLRKMQRNPSKDLPWFNKMRSWNNSPFRSKVLFTHYPISFIRFRLVWGRRL